MVRTAQPDGPRPDSVKLLGLDFGSTTSSILAMEADIASNCATGRMEFRDARATYRPAPVFTPFDGEKLDLGAARRYVTTWLDEAGIDPEDVFAGGAIVTGLAAERDNAEALAAMIVDVLGEAVVATADDPLLESWLAFMGGSAALSRTYPDVPFLNLDIGGGTTNPALGLDGNVRAAGCYFIGARHFEVTPGDYRLVRLSRFGQALLDHLGIARAPGDALSEGEVARIVGYFVDALVAMADQQSGIFETPVGRLVAQAGFTCETAVPPAVTFSGGVGELVYALAAGEPIPATTAYGDLGIDLARAIVASPRLARDIHRYVPEQRGRATVQGLTLNNTEISGTTLFLAGHDTLPVRDLPIVASLDAGADETALADALRLAGRSQRGACIQLVWSQKHPPLDGVKRLGEALAKALTLTAFSADAPLVVLTTANVGKALGNYATGWRTSDRKLMIIDEIPPRNAHFVNLGRMRNGVVPVSFYGMN